MDGLVAVRSNATGLMSPTQEARAAVTKQLAETAAIRAGDVTAQQTAKAASATNNSTKGVAATGATDDTSGSTNPLGPQTLGKDAFLQLLVLQMKNQDPLSPQDNTAMVAQLAQFSALEAQTNLNKNFETLSGNVDQLNFISGSQLLGRTVTGLDADGNIKTGVVQSVHLDGSLVMLDVEGTLMSMANIYGIASPAAAETPST